MVDWWPINIPGEFSFPSKANYVDTRIGKTAAVGTFDANGYGIHDIGGNLREWTWDWYDDRTYEYDWKETFPDANGIYDLVDEGELHLFHDLKLIHKLSVFGPFSNQEFVKTNGESIRWKNLLI